MNNRTIKKLFLWLFIAFFLPFLLGITLGYHYEKKIRKDGLLSSTQKLLHDLRLCLAEPANSFAPQEVARIAHLISLDPNVVEISVYSDKYDISLARIEIPERRVGDLFTYEAPIFFETRPVGKIQLTVTANAIEKEISPLTKTFFLILTGMYLTGFLIMGIIFTKTIARPMQKLLVQIQSIDSGQLDEPFSWTGNSEFAKLGSTIEAMREKLLSTFRTLHDEARTDPLTGILNRREFTEKATTALSYCQQKNLKFSLIMLDLDDFKQINDTYGHDVGDQVLNTVSSLLQENIRNEDLFARWGGEEFILALPELSLRQATIIAEKLRQLIATASCPRHIKITASLGVLQAEGTRPFSELIRQVDQAMYLAKQQGKNQVIQGTTGHLRISFVNG